MTTTKICPRPFPVPIHRISVQSNSGVKKLCAMLPLCTERHVLYPDPMSLSDPDRYCYRYLQQSLTSDSAYYSHSSASNAIAGGSLQRTKKSKKETNQLDPIMLSSLPRNFLEIPRNQFSSSYERPEVAQSSGSDMSSAGLYAAILPKKHDPTLPSTSAEPIRTTSGSAAIVIPPSLFRIVNAPIKTSFTKLKLCLKLNETDLTNPKIQFDENLQNLGDFEEPQFCFTLGSNRIFSDQAYDTVYPSSITQSELCPNCLPDLLQTLFSGYDASLMYFGAISRRKQDLLYSRVPHNPSSNGIFICALQWLFRLVDEFRFKKKDVRYSIRISALHYSQRTEKLIDLFSDVCNNSPSEEVKCNEDPAFGITVENRSEIRVETVDQALFYLDRVYDHRVTEDEEIQRTSHTFFYINLYRYKTDGECLQSGKSRLCLVDLGLGEKNSKSGYMTMPVLGTILLSIFQGQKHLPSRQNTLCRLLKESIGSAKNKSTLILSSFAPIEGRCPVETENLIQLAVKMRKAVKKNTASPGSRRSLNLKNDSSTGIISPAQIEPVEYNSSSEQSCAETVIFLGPSNSTATTGYNGCSTLPPIPGSPIKQKSSSSKGSHSGRKSNHSRRSGTPEPLPPPQIIPIDCPPNAVVHSSASLHSLSLTSSPKRPTNLFYRNSGSMPSTPVQIRSARQSSVPTDLILCNPMVANSLEKLNGGSLKKTKRQPMNQLDDEFFGMDPEKLDMVLHWVMEQKVEYGADICGIGKPFPPDYNGQVEKYITATPNKVDSCIQCNEEDIDNELLNVWNQARFLDDIVEDDEEPSTASVTKTSPSTGREALAEKMTPLNILSKEADVLGELNNLVLERMKKVAEIENDENLLSPEMTDEELEKAMAASISSIKSHEILSRLASDFPQDAELPESLAPSMVISATDSKPPTETDFYRRASHLEAYAAEKLLELQFKELDKKDMFKCGAEKIKKMLACVEPTTISIHSEHTRKSGFLTAMNPPKILDEQKGESLLSKLKLKQLTCCNPMTTSVASSSSIGTNTIHSSLANSPFKTVKVSVAKPPRAISPVKEKESPISPLPPEVAKQITDQLRSAGLGRSPSLLPVSTNSSPIRTAARSRKDSDPSKKPAKSKSSKDRRGSTDSVKSATQVPSPYSKVTTAKPQNGTYSSGHGSDETCSTFGVTKVPANSISMPHVNSGFLNGKNRPRNRESFSASSGYESADYGKGKYKIAMQSPSPNGTVSSSGIKKPSTGAIIIAQKEISSLRALRDSLAVQLSEAQKRLGLSDQIVVEDEAKYTGIASDVLIDLLKQETRQLERRLNTCRSHTMMVTTFL